ncbi:MAG: ATP-binding protein [SAR324 cluster bacterium]|nr:ATP-binding protein [SAR324 cluster bacterium]
MLELIKELILDFQEEAISGGVPRHLDYELVSQKAFICIGVRRCGKSTLLMQIIQNLLKRRNISAENVVYINFFDDRLDALRQGQIGIISEAYYLLYPAKKNDETVYFFFDELQEIPDWEKFIERLLRTENCEVFITGSSAKLLSREIATQMGGRSLAWELFPFSFREFLDFHGIVYDRLSSQKRILIQSHFEQYLQKGGFPEVFSASEKLQLMIHQEYFKAILHRDIIERFDARHPQAVVRLGHRIVNHISSLHSLNRLTEYLKSLGYKTSKQFVGECLEWFHDAYLFLPVSIYSPSLSIQNANPRKIYAIDHALVRSVSSNLLVNSGILLENLIYLHLRRQNRQIYYYRTRSRKEVDFIWKSQSGGLNLLQVSWDMSDENTRKREISALFEAMEETGMDLSMIVTHAEDGMLEKEGKTIQIIPAWKFCLSEF